jgi:hypothetical protein
LPIGVLWLAGCVVMLAPAAVTVTVKLQAVPGFPDASVGVQVTVVVPREKVEPLAGTQTNVAPGQLSLTTGLVKVTLVLHPIVTLVVTLAGQAMVGACTSETVTVNVHALVVPTASVAVHVTVVTPLGKDDPLAGTQALVTPGQLSEGVAVNVTLLAQLPPAVATEIFAGQTIEGG